MKLKAMLNVIPVFAIVGLLGSFAYQHWQETQATQLDYDNPDAVMESMQSTRHLPQSERWQVERVSDGDTLTVRSRGREQTLRLCGIDAPEKQQALGKEATEKLRSLVGSAGNEIIVVPIEKDRFGRTVAEIFVKKSSQEEIFVNGEMVRVGMAYHYQRYSERCVNRDAIDTAESIAKGKRVGVWRDRDAVKPWEWRRQQRT